MLDYGSDDDELDIEDPDEPDLSEDEDGDDETGAKRTVTADDEDEDIGGWGPSKKDYYNADAIETEQDALDEEHQRSRLTSLVQNNYKP